VSRESWNGGEVDDYTMDGEGVGRLILNLRSAVLSQVGSTLLLNVGFFTTDEGLIREE
jgi:hypothetical protein